MISKNQEKAMVGEGELLSRWRINSPFVQTLIICLVIFCVPGMNSTVLGLGAGGSHPSNIAIIDRVNNVGASVTIVAGLFGGSVNNKIGPRYTLMLGVSGYPAYLGSLWLLDQGRGVGFAYFAGVWHGISAGLTYSVIGYVVSSYSSEMDRGSYISSSWGSVAIGSSTGAAIVLGITATSGEKRSHVPPSVYITIIVIQSFGFLVTTLLVDPSRIRRNDGRPIALFTSRPWSEELGLLPKNLLKPKLLLLAVAFFSCQLPVSFAGSLNAFYFNARTRALANLCLWLAASCGSIVIAFFCDAKWLGRRPRRALLCAAVSAISILGSWSGIFWFLASHDLDRSKKPWGVDWSDGRKLSALLPTFVFIGASWSIFQGYIQWLVSTFSNEPSKLSRYSGYLESLRALGLAVAFGIDSNSVAFMTEAAAYFALIVTGLILCVISAKMYTIDSEYGKEDAVIIPQAFERATNVYPDHESAGSEKRPVVIIQDLQ